MGIYETHLVAESSGNTNHHVVNVGAYGTNAGKLLTEGEPDINTYEFPSNNLEVHIDVLKVALERTTGSSYLNFARTNLNGNYKGR